MRILALVSVLTFVIDQVTKYWVLHVLNLDRLGQIDVWPPFLNLQMAWNYGINFGLFAGHSDAMRWALILIALIIVGVVLVWTKRSEGSHWQKIAAGLLVGGALGNVLDRLVYGAVADFLNMSCCGINNPYSFNVADIAVFAGAIGMILFLEEKKGT